MKYISPPSHYKCQSNPQNKKIPTWNPVQIQEAHFEGESGTEPEFDKKALNLPHVGRRQSYP